MHTFHLGGLDADSEEQSCHCNVDKHLVRDKQCPVCKTPIDIMERLDRPSGKGQGAQDDAGNAESAAAAATAAASSAELGSGDGAAAADVVVATAVAVEELPAAAAAARAEEVAVVPSPRSQQPQQPEGAALVAATIGEGGGGRVSHTMTGQPWKPRQNPHFSVASACGARHGSDLSDFDSLDLVEG